MEEDKLKDLFEKFDPELSSPALFMEKLEEKMQAVEFVRQHYAALQRKNRRALCFAALAGFLAGAFLTALCLPVDGQTPLVPLPVPAFVLSAAVAESQLAACVLVAAASGLVAWGVYSVALTAIRCRPQYVRLPQR
ncbi:MAG: hypothetical protein J1F06_07600 [Prevotellaceae bacterium]|nr:hypothetical protein [Prevotellaceae bacterium]